jgi:hypothetical protein
MRTSKQIPIFFGGAQANQFAQKRAYTSEGALLGFGSPHQLYPVSEGAATHHIVHISDERVTRLEKEVAELRTQLERQTKAKQVSLASLGSEKYRLRKALWVELDSSGEETVTAHISELEEYGTGATEYEALEDLRLVLIEAYDFLLENAVSLGPSLASQLRRFRDLVEVV